MTSTIKTQLPIAFYNGPDHEPSFFSTRGGTVAKRSLQLPLEAPIVYSNYFAAVEAKACELQKEFPRDVWRVEDPKSWDDLYKWFDAQDIHIMGAEFLIFVLQKIHLQNDGAIASMMKAIDEEAKIWVDRNSILVTNLTVQRDIMEFVDIEDYGLTISYEQVKNWFAHSLYKYCAQARNCAEKRSPTHGANLTRAQDFAIKPPTSGLVAGFHRRASLHGRDDPQLIGDGPPSIDGLRTSAASFFPRQLTQKFDTQRSRRLSNDSFRHQQSHQQSSYHPRRFSQTKDARPRGFSTIVSRNTPASPLGMLRRHSSHQGGSTLATEPIYVVRNRRTASNTNHLSFHTQAHNGTAISMHGLQQDPVYTRENLRQYPQAVIHRENQLSHSHVSDAISKPRAQYANVRHFSSPVSSNRPALPPQDARIHSWQSGDQFSPSKKTLSPPRDTMYMHQGYHGRILSERSISKQPVASSRQISQGRLVHGLSTESPPTHVGFAPAVPGFLVRPSVTFNLKGGKTVTFNGRTRRENRDENGKSTMFIRDLPLEDFDSLNFKALLDRHGQLSDMTYLPNAKHAGPNEHGAAFIHYSSENAAGRAIKFFQQYIPPDGRPLWVNFATPKLAMNQKGFNTSIDPNQEFRPRSKELSSHGCENDPNIQHKPRSGSKHTRNNQQTSVLNQESQMYRTHQRSAHHSPSHSQEYLEPLTIGFQQQLVSATIKLEEQARYGPVSNRIANVPDKTKLNAAVYTSSKKENMPMPHCSEIAISSSMKENAKRTHSPESSSINISKNRKRSGKKTNENAFQSTPTGTPAKSSSAVTMNSGLTEVLKSTSLRTVKKPKDEAANAHNGQNRRVSESIDVKSMRSNLPKRTPVDDPSFTNSAFSCQLSVESPNTSFNSIGSDSRKQSATFQDAANVKSTRLDVSPQKPTRLRNPLLIEKCPVLNTHLEKNMGDNDKLKAQKKLNKKASHHATNLDLDSTLNTLNGSPKGTDLVLDNRQARERTSPVNLSSSQAEKVTSKSGSIPKNDGLVSKRTATLDINDESQFPSLTTPPIIGNATSGLLHSSPNRQSRSSGRQQHKVNDNVRTINTRSQKP